MQNKLTLSIDWEDFAQLICRDFHGIYSTPGMDIDRQTDRILSLLDSTNRRATFFVLGMLAKSKPNLVRKIDEQGHEIALHGNQHIAMDRLDKKDAQSDILDSYSIVTDIIGKPLYGYRAPYFSVGTHNLYILECLAEAGLEYDSSIFPMKLPRYGISGFAQENKLYALENGSEIVELPLTLLSLGSRKFPVAGGGYLRLMPKPLMKSIYRTLIRDDAAPIVYVHPYEFDDQRLRSSANFPSEAPAMIVKTLKSDFRWNIFRKSMYEKIRYLLKTYQFETCKEKADHVRKTSNGATVLG